MAAPLRTCLLLASLHGQAARWRAWVGAQWRPLAAGWLLWSQSTRGLGVQSARVRSVSFDAELAQWQDGGPVALF